MIHTPLRSFALALMLAPLVVACGEKTIDDTGDPDTTPEGTDAPDYFEPDYFSVDGIFAYDAENNQARGYTLPDGTTNPVFMSISVFNNNDYNPNDDSTYCVVQFVTESLVPAASWITAASAGDNGTVAFGFEFDDATQVGSDCGDFNFNPNVWGSADDAIAAIAGWDWGLGVGTIPTNISSSLQDAVVSQIDQQTWDDEWAPYALGGGFYWEAFAAAGDQFPGSYSVLGYSTGFAVDDSFTLAYDDVNENGSYDQPTQAGGGDELISITTADALDGTLPSGVYSISAWYILPAECLMGLESCPQ